VGGGGREEMREREREREGYVSWTVSVWLGKERRERNTYIDIYPVRKHYTPPLR